MTDQCEMCAGTKVDTVFGGRCEWCDETGKAGGLTPLPNGPLAMLPAMLDAVNHGVGVMLITAHKGAEHVPLQAFRRDVPRYKGMNVGLDSDCVLASDYDTAQSELAALREELAGYRAANMVLRDEVKTERLRGDAAVGDANEAEQRLADAKRRNAELEKDTVRYQWLRKNNILAHVQVTQADDSTPYVYAEELDRSIDEIMEAQAALTKPEEAKS
jgi:hypothetical protein